MSSTESTNTQIKDIFVAFAAEVEKVILNINSREETIPKSDVQELVSGLLTNLSTSATNFSTNLKQVKEHN